MPIHRNPFRNVFTTARNVKEPRVLSDGTSVEFPLGWTPDEVEAWRLQQNLVKVARNGPATGRNKEKATP